MKKTSLHYLDKTAKTFEYVVALLLLLVIAIKVIEVVLELTGFKITIISMEFERILSTAFALVIGVEFTKMLCKHTPETVIDVLLFAIARQTVIYYERTTDLLVGVAAIAGLFAAKKYLIDTKYKKTESSSNEPSMPDEA